MNKYSRRVKKLYSKTHYFLSGSQMRLLKRYFEARFDEANAKPEDFAEICQQLREILTDKSLTKYQRSSKCQEVIRGGLGGDVLKYNLNEEMLKAYPNGIYLHDSQSNHFKQIIINAKTYFRGKTSEF